MSQIEQQLLKPAPQWKGDASLVDPITLELVKGTLHSTLSEMEALIERTSMSPFIREKKDFHAGLFDAAGKLVATTSMGPGTERLVATVHEVYPLEEMQDGDVYWFNDCYASKGAVSHTPDQVFLLPCFVDGRLVAYVEGWAHFNDVGGMRAGSLSSDCTEIFQEGVIVPPVRFVRGGVINNELLRLFSRNSRFPDIVRGDVRALLAAVHVGQRRIVDAVQRFGAEELSNCFSALIERTEREAKAQFRKVFANGVYEASERIDSDGQGNGPFDIRFRLEVSDDRVVLDARDTDDQSPGPVNLLMAQGMPAYMLSDYLLSNNGRAFANEGYRLLIDEVKLREGSLLQPVFPAPLGMRGSTIMRQMVACMGLVADASGGQCNAAHSAYVIYHLRGRRDDGSLFLLSDGLGVGYGARPTADGNDAIYLVANENYPCEFVETSYPIRVVRYAIHPDTGGPGRFRGGCGVIREMEVLAPEAMLSVRIDSTNSPPWGVNGGMPARPGACVVNPGTDKERMIAPVSDGFIVRRGDIVRVMTGGGGGWGDPLERSTASVINDVLGGFVGVESARRDYGVVLTPNGLSVDEEKTVELRASIRLTARGEALSGKSA